MFDWQFDISFLGRFLLAFYFIKAGVNNAINWPRVIGFLKSKHVPFAPLALMIAVIIQIIGSFFLIIDFHIMWAATGLIIFTLLANFLICNYWTMEGVQRKNVSFLFYANVAIVGALLLVIASNSYVG